MELMILISCCNEISAVEDCTSEGKHILEAEILPVKPSQKWLS